MDQQYQVAFKRIGTKFNLKFQINKRKLECLGYVMRSIGHRRRNKWKETCRLKKNPLAMDSKRMVRTIQYKYIPNHGIKNQDSFINCQPSEQRWDLKKTTISLTLSLKNNDNVSDIEFWVHNNAILIKSEFPSWQLDSFAFRAQRLNYIQNNNSVK